MVQQCTSTDRQSCTPRNKLCLRCCNYLFCSADHKVRWRTWPPRRLLCQEKGIAETSKHNPAELVISQTATAVLELQPVGPRHYLWLVASGGTRTLPLMVNLKFLGCKNIELDTKHFTVFIRIESCATLTPWSKNNKNYKPSSILMASTNQLQTGYSKRKAQTDE